MMKCNKFDEYILREKDYLNLRYEPKIEEYIEKYQEQDNF